MDPFTRRRERPTSKESALARITTEVTTQLAELEKELGGYWPADTSEDAGVGLQVESQRRHAEAFLAQVSEAALSPGLSLVPVDKPAFDEDLLATLTPSQHFHHLFKGVSEEEATQRIEAGKVAGIATVVRSMVPRYIPEDKRDDYFPPQDNGEFMKENNNTQVTESGTLVLDFPSQQPNATMSYFLSEGQEKPERILFFN